ncbi:hypothetical protein [Actinoplanes couchii]|uniref:hypothetical protein n=1 Tax=Actinoplanes couchii TaxID=403638 RepID=UPI0019445F65|nr:hypothetical protein [Actinoplanes couchii]MDR6324381.1 hypothetical protein [Actinoplanes couchii]
MARRSWRPGLLVTGVSVSLPLAAVELGRGLAEAAGYPAVASMPDVIAAAGSVSTLMMSVVLPVVLLGVAVAVGSVGWAGGIWALTAEAVTGRPVRVADAYRYGLSRLTRLGPWTLAAALLLVAGLAAFVVPGIYLLFALSLFSFGVLFEHDRRPLLRSFALTHARLGRALARWGMLAAVTVAIEATMSLVFGTLSLVLLGDPGFGADGHGLAGGLIDAIHTAVGAPVWALLVIGLTVTYADLRQPRSN